MTFYNTASINTIYDELKLSVRQEELLKTNEGITFKNSLILNNVEFGYPDPNKIILNKINLEIYSKFKNNFMEWTPRSI